jgi:hypothetical protein
MADNMTLDTARRLVRAVEDAFGAADLTAIEQGFTEDAIARFADFPEMRGREAIMRFLRARFARTQGYRLKKTLHCVMGATLANTWDASWHDVQTGNMLVGTDFISATAARAVGCDVQRMVAAVRRRRRWFDIGLSLDRHGRARPAQPRASVPEEMEDVQPG